MGRVNLKFAGLYLISILLTQMHFVWGDSNGSEYVRQVPHQVSMLRENGNLGVNAKVSGLFDYADSCEKDGYYDYQIRDQEIVIDSYKEVQKNGICLQKYNPDVAVDFEIQGLQSGETYHVYFLDEKGEAQFVGDLSTDPNRMFKKILY